MGVAAWANCDSLGDKIPPHLDVADARNVRNGAERHPMLIEALFYTKTLQVASVPDEFPGSQLAFEA